MSKKTRVLFFVVLFLAVISAVSLSQAAFFRSSIYSYLKSSLSFSARAGTFFNDAIHWRQDREELRLLRQKMTDLRDRSIQSEELRLENERLRELLELRNAVPASVETVVAARVIGKSPSGALKVMLLDKGREDGLQPNMLVTAESSLVGKLVEVGPSVSKALLIQDPGSRIGVLIQRTRQEGVMIGTLSGECRVKYLSVETLILPGDIVETAGFGKYFPKGIPVGKVKKVWKEPGQIYQVAEIAPFADLRRLEEVLCIE